MKKFIFLLIISFLLVSKVDASSINLSAGNFQATEGGSFDAIITLNPENSKSYTTKLVLNFPPDLLSINSFEFGPKWLALNQTGYDLTDNKAGIFIKTAGYPNGTDQVTVFGKIKFNVKKSGNGKIIISNSSLSFDENSQNTLNNFPTESTIIAKEKTIPVVSAKKNESKIVVEELIPPAPEPIGEPEITIEEITKPEPPVLFDIEIKQGDIPESKKSTGRIFIIIAVILIIFITYLVVNEFFKKPK